MATDTNPRVAFICHPWDRVVPPVEGSSIPIWTYQVASRLADRCDFAVYSMCRSRRPTRQDQERVQYRRFPTAGDLWRHRFVRRIPGVCGERRPFFGSRWYYPGYIKKIAKDLQDERCDVVHVHQFSQFVPVIRSHLPDARIVLHMHCEWLTQLDEALIAERLSQTDLVIGCSDYITGKIRHRFPRWADRCATVYNGVGTDYGPAADGLGSGRRADRKRLLFVGRVSPEKGVHVAIDAFAKVAEQIPDVELEIVGPEASAPMDFIVGMNEDRRIAALASFYAGSYGAQLRSRVPTELSDRVSFAGAVPHSEMVQRYRQADLLVNPSFSESFGMSLIEAMACAVPVVATRVGGMPAIVERTQGGLLVEPGDVDGLAEAIVRLLCDDDDRATMGRAASERVRDRFSWERVAADLWHQYERLLVAR